MTLSKKELYDGDCGKLKELSTFADGQLHIELDHEGGCFQLIAATIKEAFKPLTYAQLQSEQKARAIIKTKTDFMNSALVEMWCDCSDNFESGRLLKEFNKFVSEQLEIIKLDPYERRLKIGLAHREA